jgi:hypothetical protein
MGSKHGALADGPPPGGPITDEHCAFLAAHSRAFLIVNGPNGAPIGYPMTSRLFDGALEFNTYRKSAKMAHIIRDGRVCCVVVPRDRAADPRVLTLWGRAEPDEGSVAPWIEASRDATATPGFEVPVDIAQQVRQRLLSGKRVIVRVALLGAAFVPAAIDVG